MEPTLQLLLHSIFDTKLHRSHIWQDTNTTAPGVGALLILVCSGGSSVTCTKAEQNVDCKLYEGSDNVSAARRYPNTQT